jgi:hypothetical protein
MKSAFAVSVRAARALAGWVSSLSRWVIALVLVALSVIVALLLTMILMEALGLKDYAIYVAWVVNLVVVTAVGAKLFRWALGSRAGPESFGPGSEGHRQFLRTTVKEALKRSRRKKPYPHA